jgi:hypothetical protein
MTLLRKAGRLLHDAGELLDERGKELRGWGVGFIHVLVIDYPEGLNNYKDEQSK